MQKGLLFNLQNGISQSLEKVELAEQSYENQGTNLQDSSRKQSDQFVFQEHVQQQNEFHAEKRKQSDQFVFEDTHNPQQFAALSTPPVQQLAEQKQNIEAQDQQVNQNHSNYSQSSKHPTTTTQPDILNGSLTSPTPPKPQNQQPAASIDEDDQFGEFEETATHAQPSHTAHASQPSPPQQPSIVEIYEEVLPYGTEATTKRQELQQLVNSLPDYSALFISAAQSL